MGTLHLTVCLMLLFLCHCCFLASAGLQAPPPLLIKDKSYTIWAKIAIRLAHSSRSLEVVETYSHWQDRSKLDYRSTAESADASEGDKMPDSALVFADKKQLLVKTKQECIAMQSEVLDEFMNLNAFKDFTFSQAIVGPSKILHIMLSLEHMKSFRSRKETSSQYGHNTSQPIIVFNYDLNEKTEASLYYHDDANSNLPNGLPFQIMLVTGPNKNLLIYYAFNRFEVQPEGPIYSRDRIIRQFESQGSLRVRYDALAVQPEFGCGNSMSSPLARDLKNPLLSTEYRFSFEAQVKMPHISETIVHYVAYEPSIKTLRVQKVQETKATEILVDYQSDELFHVIKRRAADDPVLDHLIRIDGRSRTDSTCIRTVNTKRLVTLGEMLFGSNEVIYLGVAEVRGIEARAYIAIGGSWPTWYEQGISFHKANKNFSSFVQNLYSRPNDKHSRFTTVFYLSNNHRQDPTDELSGPLLHMEITHEMPVAQTSDVTSIPVYGFSWQLGSYAPNGQPIEQFFSLGDSCISPTREDNHYAQVDLVLERDWPLNRKSDAEWLQGAVRRNFALMRMMQERCHLPASMIYAIDSRRVRSPSSSLKGLEESFHIAVTMRAVEHTRTLTRLISLGQGDVRFEWAQDSFFRVGLFHACYMVAAHMKSDVVIFYSPIDRTCNVFRAADPNTEKLLNLVDFEVSPPFYEIYRVEHRSERKIGPQGDEITQLRHSQQTLSKLSTIFLINAEGSGRSTFLEMALKSVQVRELDRKVPTEVDQIELADTDKFLGLGLVATEDSELSRLVEPARMLDVKNSDDRSQKLSQLTNEMTIGRCVAECLSDFECQSYSVCVSYSKVECVISKVDFRSPYMLSQLAQVRDKRTKAGENIKLKVDRLEDKDAVVVVTKRPSCELHNKSYKQLFVAGTKNYVDVLRRQLHPATGREDCAKLCVHSTLKTLKSEVQEAHKINAQAYKDPESHPEEIRAAYRSVKSSNLNLCSTFMYLDRLELLSLSKSVRLGIERLTGTAEDNWKTNGYCILGDVPSVQEIEELKKMEPLDGPLSRLDLMVEHFDFDFGFMFEEHHGVSLAKAPISHELTSALSSIHSLSAKQKDYALVREFLNEGNNIEAINSASNPGECARTCFLQMSILWPACKSVDVFEMDFRHAGKQVFCFYNSHSLRELLLGNRDELIHTAADEQTRIYSRLFVERVTHYEPKGGFIAESLGLMSELQVSEAEVEGNTQNELARSHIGSFALMFTILLALIFGMSVGLTLGQRVLELAAEKRQDIETLVKQNEVRLGELGSISASNRRQQE